MFLDEGAFYNIKISVKSMKQLFHPCTIDYIQNICHGRCCESSNGLMVTIHKSEIKHIRSLGGVVSSDGFLVDINNNKKCCFKKNDLCSIHTMKPFGCKASPFTLSKNNILIIRNRYRRMKCFKAPGAVPAYIAHRWSLEQIFGFDETERIVNCITSGCAMVFGKISIEKFNMLVENDRAKKRIKKK